MNKANKCLILILAFAALLPFQNCSSGFETAATVSSSSTQNPPPASGLFSATIAWDKSTSEGVTGYKVYVGTQTGSYSTILDANVSTAVNSPQYEIKQLDRDLTYYAVVKARNAAGEESAPSNEIVISGQ